MQMLPVSEQRFEMETSLIRSWNSAHSPETFRAPSYGPTYTEVLLLTFSVSKPGYRSLYSAWLRAGRPRGRSSSRGRGKILLLFVSSSPVLGPTQSPIQWVTGARSPAVKRPGREADHSPPTNA
jgi:hypothetical protein